MVYLVADPFAVASGLLYQRVGSLASYVFKTFDSRSSEARSAILLQVAYAKLSVV